MRRDRPSATPRRRPASACPGWTPTGDEQGEEHPVAQRPRRRRTLRGALTPSALSSIGPGGIERPHGRMTGATPPSGAGSTDGGSRRTTFGAVVRRLTAKRRGSPSGRSCSTPPAPVISSRWSTA
jgi:hypothetical protein